MALLEDLLEEVLEGFPPNALLGVGVLAALAFPARVPGVRPVAKELLKAGLILTHGVMGLVGEVGAQWAEVFAEARAELGQPAPRQTSARTAGRRVAKGAAQEADKA